MKHSDFSIGLDFFAAAGFAWRCTDIGVRTITAIRIEDGRDALWYKGPPYSVEEVVFDEYELSSCHRNWDEAIETAIHNADTSGHPGYPHEDVSLMLKEQWASEASAKYPNQGLLRFDRVREDGELLHAYAARKSGESWSVRLYLPFLHEYTEIPEIDFLGLPIATDVDIEKRAKTEESVTR